MCSEVEIITSASDGGHAFIFVSQAMQIQNN